MSTITLSDILDDLGNADQRLRRFEQRYWVSSSQGLLDDGEHAEDFAEWAGTYKLKQKRERALEELSSQRVTQLQSSHPEVPELAANFPHHRHEPPISNKIADPPPASASKPLISLPSFKIASNWAQK